uniref:Uncharacterized protein n=1 Tax=Acrobeloides nanus TaxID=290746 RepID=A0A914BUL2_9BILA
MVFTVSTRTLSISLKLGQGVDVANVDVTDADVIDVDVTDAGIDITVVDVTDVYVTDNYVAKGTPLPRTTYVTFVYYYAAT